jgi:drug/metabolite transporter (DMT)-like permease
MNFIGNHIGELAALLTAIFWTVTSIAFEDASRKVGSVAVNFLRLVAGFIFLSIFTMISRGLPFPVDASAENWIWLTLSGFIGFVFGDLFLFKSYTMIGSRFSMLIMTLVPPITALAGWIIMDERLTALQYFGMMLTFSGIAMAVFSRERKGERISLKLSPRGILYAFGGAVGQALGLVLSKFGMKDYDPFASTQIRILAGIVGFATLITVIGRWNGIRSALNNANGMKSLTIGAIFGPFLGVSFSLIAVKHTQTGIASTIMALVPVFILLPAVLLFRQKVTLAELAGSILSVGGVAILFI